MRNAVHIPCDCLECEKNQKRLEIFKKLTRFIDSRINLLKVKCDIGMASSTDKAEWDELKEILPATLGDKNE